MSSNEKHIEMNPMNPSATSTSLAPPNAEEDVIIGRFRKISSAKSMATNGNNSFSDNPLPKPDQDDLESGLQFRNLDNSEEDKLLKSQNKVNVVNGGNKAEQVTRSSIKAADKPPRERAASARFQMSDSSYQATEESAEDSDDPLTGTDTKYGKSFRHFTREALPRLDNYRNMLSLHAANRPTLDELHNASLSGKPGLKCEVKECSPEPDRGMLKFGWIQGVLIRCLLNIWGVMLFLRLTWVVAQAGVGQSLLLILTTSAVTIITALSMSAISTNGVIKGGGTYYMISRSLGPEFGGSIGLIFSAANAVACAMYVVGFCESLDYLIPETAVFISKSWDPAVYGCVTIILLTGIVVIGMEWETKAQIGLLVILLLAIVDFVIGTFIGPKSETQLAQGYIGYNMTLLANNMGPDYRFAEGVNHNFFTVFSIFFPAATGILAGANISGDLKDPQTSIPKGTLLAIFITTISYLLIAIMSGWTFARDASGIVEELANNTFLDCANRTCKYGLHNNFQVVEMISAFGPLIYAGCFAATLSSALASLVSAPKVFQALCKDRLYPGLEWFGKGFGKNNEPVRGYILTLVIAIAFILIGNLNTIAPLISNFFLAAYTLINFSTFHASLAKPVGWRPTFKYYNMWLSLFGAIICVSVMFLISWYTALITFAVVLALYLIVSYKKPDVNWGSTTQAQTYKTALSGVQHLNRVIDHVKNYRPQVLVLTGFPGVRPALSDFTYLITKGHSLMICGHIVPCAISSKTREALSSRAYSWFTKRKIKAFYALVDDCNLQSGAAALIQATGLGKLKPNILMMGFKNDWNTCLRSELNDYVEIMHKALDVHMALAILRVEGGLDYSAGLDAELQACLEQIDGQTDSSLFNKSSHYKESNESLVHSGAAQSQASSLSDLSIGTGRGVSVNPNALNDEIQRKPKKDGKNSVLSAVTAAVNKAVSGARRTSSFVGGIPLHHFSKKQSGTIDVWWLYDDGGLTLLLPYILSTRRNWGSCRLRVFTIANKQAEMEFEERSMASLLSKFRIDYSDLKLIPDITKKPKDSTLAYFDKLIANFKEPEDPNDPDSAPIKEADLLAARDRTNRQLRLRELLNEHSQSARLIVVTLPMPRRRSVVPPALYAAWLHAITSDNDLPPVLLVRGNHTSVLTFYS